MSDSKNCGKKCGKKCKCIEVTQDVCTQGLRCTLLQFQKLGQRVCVRTSLSYFGLPTWHCGTLASVDCGTIQMTDVVVNVGDPFGSGTLLEFDVTLPICEIQSVFQEPVVTLTASAAGAGVKAKAESKESIVDKARKLAKGV